MIIRQAMAGDAEALSALNWEFNNVRIDPDLIAERLKSGVEIVVIAETEGRITGFGCAQVYTSICSDKPTAELTELYLCPSSRGSGCASGILEKIELLARKQNAAVLRLETGISNQPARRFYEKHGYTLDDEVAYYKKL